MPSKVVPMNEIERRLVDLDGFNLPQPNDSHDEDELSDEENQESDVNTESESDATEETSCHNPPPVISLRRQTNIQRELADAIFRWAPLEELRVLILCGADLNTPITQGLTPLHYAVWQNYPEAANYIVEQGCDPNICDAIGYSALHLSAERGNLDLIEVLLNHDARVDFTDQTVYEEFPMDVVDEPLRLALKNDHLEAARLLLEHGANPNARYFFGREINLLTPFNTEAMNLLLSHGADPNSRDRQSFTPIMKACRLTQGLDAVLLLLSFGADVNLKTDDRHDNRSVLHYAVLSGSVEMVSLLLKQGAQMNLGLDYGRPSALDLAIVKGDLDIVKLFVSEGADLNCSSPILGSPLHIACSDGVPNRVEIIKILLENGADPNLVVYNEEEKPLRQAMGEYLASNEDPQLEVIQLMLRYGAEVVMQSQNHDARGILCDLPDMRNHPKVLSALLSAAHTFDLELIRQSSHINEEQRQHYLTAGDSALSLKHQSRVTLRKYLGSTIFKTLHKLELPFTLYPYLMYEFS